LLRTPELAVAAASRSEPTRFPAKLPIQMRASAPAVTVRDSTPDGHHQVVPGEQLRAGEDDQGERHSEGGTHDRASGAGAGGLQRRADGEDEHDPQADIGAGQRERTRYCHGLCRRSPALVRAAVATAAIVSCSIVVSGARLAAHEDPPALDADLVGGDAHRRVVQALPGAQVEGLLEDGRGDLGDPALSPTIPRDST
jgi:hypothetical protein